MLSLSQGRACFCAVASMDELIGVGGKRQEDCVEKRAVGLGSERRVRVERGATREKGISGRGNSRSKGPGA